MITDDEEDFSAATVDMEEDDDHLDLEGDDDESEEDDGEGDANDTTTSEAAEEGSSADEEDGESPEEKRREQRKLERQRKKQQRLRKIQESQIKLQEMQSKYERVVQEVDSLKNKAMRYEYDEIDTQLNKGLRGIELAQQALQKAREEGDAIAYADAQQALQQAQNHTQQMKRIKEGMLREASIKQETKPGLSARAESYGKQWLAQNEHWMKKGGRPLTVAVTALDSDIMARGYNPDTPEYWKALSRECRQMWPQFFETKRPVIKKAPVTAPVVKDKAQPSKDSEQGLPKSFLKNLDDSGLTGDARKRAIANYRQMKKQG